MNDTISHYLIQFEAAIQALSALDLLAILAVVAISKLAQWWGMLPYAIFALPGTALHEAAHWITAKALFASPTFPSLIPNRTEGYWRLGSVNCAATWLNVVPIAMAPFALIPLSFIYAAYVMHQQQGWSYALSAWITGTALQAGFPSSQDWKVAAPVLCVATSVIGFFVLVK